MNHLSIFPFDKQLGIIQHLQSLKYYTVYDFEENHNMVLRPDGVYEFKENLAATVNPEAEMWLPSFLELCTTPDTEGVFNASYNRDRAGNEAVIICPGYMQRLILEDHFHLESGLAFVLGHELGHAIEDDLDPIPLLECVNSNIANRELREPTEFEDEVKLPLWKRVLSWTKPKPPVKPLTEKEKIDRRIKILFHYAGEMIADQLGDHVLAEEMKRVNDPMKKLQMTRSAWKPLCSTDVFSDGVHPPTEFRITQIMRRNPEINEAMGCIGKPTLAPRNGCSLSGMTENKY